jgi:para-nitrobenzyl esterase
MKLEQQFPGRQAIAHSIFKSGTEAEALASQQKMSLVQFVVAQAYQLAAMNTQPGFLYHFSYVPTDKPGFPNYGAFHTSEVPFALHTLSKWNRPWKAGDLEVEKQVSSYLLNFIKTGNPNGPGLAEWPAFRAESGNIMEFGEKPEMRNRLFLEEVRLMTNSKP